VVENRRCPRGRKARVCRTIAFAPSPRGERCWIGDGRCDRQSHSGRAARAMTPARLARLSDSCPAAWMPDYPERRRSRAPAGAVNVRDEATGAIVHIVDFPLVVRVRSPPRTRPAAPDVGDVSDFPASCEGVGTRKRPSQSLIARPNRSPFRGRFIVRQSPSLNGFGKYSSLTARATRMVPPNPPSVLAPPRVAGRVVRQESGFKID
jgi:hypothetical protein